MVKSIDNEGRPVYSPEGKVMKGPNYKPPYLKDIVTGEWKENS